MPGNTPNRGYPFPLAGEPPAGHTQMQDLAMALDGDIRTVIYASALAVFQSGKPMTPGPPAVYNATVSSSGQQGTIPWTVNTATGAATCPYTGLYLVTVNVTYNGLSNGEAYIGAWVNGAEKWGVVVPVTTAGPRYQNSGVVAIAAGNILQPALSISAPGNCSGVTTQATFLSGT